MFYNIGDKVKGLAIALLIIGIIGSIAGAIVLWVEELVIAGFAVLVGGCISAWFGSWIVYCIGETNNNTSEFQWKIKELQSIVNKLNASPKTLTVTEKNSIESEKQTSETAAQDEWHEEQKRVVEEKTLQEGFSRAIPVSGGNEKCENCGTVQVAGCRICWNCGAKLVRNK